MSLPIGHVTHAVYAGWHSPYRTNQKADRTSSRHRIYSNEIQCSSLFNSKDIQVLPLSCVHEQIQLLADCWDAVEVCVVWNGKHRDRSTVLKSNSGNIAGVPGVEQRRIRNHSRCKLYPQGDARGVQHICGRCHALGVLS